MSCRLFTCCLTSRDSTLNSFDPHEYSKSISSRISLELLSARFQHLLATPFSPWIKQICPDEKEPGRWRVIIVAVREAIAVHGHWLNPSVSVYLPFILSYVVVLVDMGATVQWAVDMAQRFFSEGRLAPVLTGRHGKLVRVFLDYLLLGKDLLSAV